MPVEAHRDQAVGIDHDPEPARSDQSVGVGSGRRSHHIVGTELHEFAERLDVVRTDVELGIAEPIDPQHLGDHLITIDAAQRHDAGEHAGGIDRLAHLGQVDPVAQMGGHRREHVAPCEGLTRRGKVKVGVGELDGAPRSACHRDGRREEPVVGTDEDGGTIGDLHRDRAARGSDTGIDHREHDTGRDVLNAARA